MTRSLVLSNLSFYVRVIPGEMPNFRQVFDVIRLEIIELLSTTSLVYLVLMCSRVTSKSKWSKFECLEDSFMASLSNMVGLCAIPLW